MESNISNVKGNIFLIIIQVIFFILITGVFSGSSWAAFESSFPDNTVYEMHSFEHGFHGGDAGAWGANDQLFILKERFTFMSDGTFTSNLISDDGLNRFIGENQNGNNTFLTTYTSESDIESGTYSVSSDGTITITFDPGGEDEETGTGFLSEDLSTVIFSYSDYDDSERYGSFGIGVGIKKGSGFSGNFPDNTVYEMRSFEHGFHGGDEGAWGANDELFLLVERFTFMSDGTFTSNLISDDRLNRLIGENQNNNNTFLTTYNSESDTESGEYSISSDGTVTITFDPGGDDEDSGAGFLSEDGSTFVFSYSEFNDSERYGSFGFGVGIKKGSGFSSSFPDNTVYEMRSYESGFHGGDEGAWGANDELFLLNERFTFMSDGTFTSNLVKDEKLNRFIGENQNGNNTFLTTYTSESDKESGTYSVSSDGTVTITFDPGGEDEDSGAGFLSEDGSTFIFSFSDFNDSERYGSFGIGVGIKSVYQKKSNLSAILPLLLE